MINFLQLDAFADELAKIAASKEEEAARLKKVMKPGDILYTKPKNIKNSNVFMRAFYGIEKKIQGSEYTHVGLYDGNGKVIDSGSVGVRKGKGLAVHHVPLEKYLDHYDFKVLRTNATPKERLEAVEYAKRHIGKKFNVKGMLRLVLPFKSKNEEEERERKDAADSFFCSELVANSFHGLNIAKDKKLHHVMPGDIYKSPLTRTITESDVDD